MAPQGYFFYFDKTTKQVTIMLLVTILLIYKLNTCSIFYTHHRIHNETMITINFDTIANNCEVIYVIKTVIKYY
jgi:hypothetical protein